MKPKRITSWEELEALPEGKWVEIRGIDFDIQDETRTRRAVRVVIPLSPDEAKRLTPRTGEVLEAHVKGRSLELVRRRAKGRQPSRS
jgi:hypothetical protein